MEFWGEQVKPGAMVSCKVDGDDFVIHLSQAALGESKKLGENVIVSVKIDDKKIVLGTLSVEKHPQISCDLVFDKHFELSHNSKTASVFFCGYKSPVPLFEPGEGSSDEEPEADHRQNNENKISAAKVPEKVQASSSDDDDDFTDSESDSEMFDEDDSSDDNELSSGADPSDDSGDYSDSEEQSHAPKKTDVLVGKKRAIEAEAPSGKKAKSEQSAQKTGDKNVSTHHSGKQSSKTDKKSPKSGSHACKSCNKSFGSASALESHQKAKKHEA